MCFQLSIVNIFLNVNVFYIQNKQGKLRQPHVAIQRHIAGDSCHKHLPTFHLYLLPVCGRSPAKIMGLNLNLALMSVVYCQVEVSAASDGV